jgi:hypothetical protein
MAFVFPAPPVGGSWFTGLDTGLDLKGTFVECTADLCARLLDASTGVFTLRATLAGPHTLSALDVR